MSSGICLFRQRRHVIQGEDEIDAVIAVEDVTVFQGRLRPFDLRLVGVLVAVELEGEFFALVGPGAVLDRGVLVVFASRIFLSGCQDGRIVIQAVEMEVGRLVGEHGKGVLGLVELIGDALDEAVLVMIGDGGASGHFALPSGEDRPIQREGDGPVRIGIEVVGMLRSRQGSAAGHDVDGILSEDRFKNDALLSFLVFALFPASADPVVIESAVLCVGAGVHRKDVVAGAFDRAVGVEIEKDLVLESHHLDGGIGEGAEELVSDRLRSRRAAVSAGRGASALGGRRAFSAASCQKSDAGKEKETRQTFLVFHFVPPSGDGPQSRWG